MDILGPGGVLRTLPASSAGRTGSNTGPVHNTVSIRNRWVGKAGRVRREGMGKRVNFCARSVVSGHRQTTLIVPNV